MIEVPIPRSIQALPLDPVRKIPVPWFVPWVDGKPEFRMASTERIAEAVLRRLCWVCGERLNNRATYLIGPMCVINRISAEPPSHLDCARYSVKACPFLSRPHMVRREDGLPDERGPTAGVMITRNPGVIALWDGRVPGANLLPHGGGILFQLHPPIGLSFWAEGRPATRAEVDRSVETGVPILRVMCDHDGPAAHAKLDAMIAEAAKLFDLFLG